MFKLKSGKLEREFKVTDGYLYASQIINTYSGMNFIPDGSGTRFRALSADLSRPPAPTSSRERFLR